MRVPLIIRAPGVKGGTRTAGLTELIDIYPTLCELAGLPVPVHTEGRSFAPLLNDPQLPWKEQAIGRFQAGDTIRTDRYRFTEYSPAQRPPVANMLYDHKNDPQENVNLSGQSAASETVQQLTDRLRAAKGKDDKQQSAVR